MRPTSLTPSLTSALSALAHEGRILVAVDFDGTLAPLVEEPMAARALPGSMALLTTLAALPNTLVAIISGRDLATLRALSGAAEPLLLIGSHGIETSFSASRPVMDTAEQARYAALDTDLQRLLLAHPRARIERKPHALVLHTRGLSATDSEAALSAGEALVSRHTDIIVTPGKEVLEMATRHVGKGSALRELAADHGVDAALFVGDDVTDEAAFAVLGPRDLTVKVGSGRTRAAHVVADEAAVLDLLGVLVTVRGSDAVARPLP